MRIDQFDIQLDKCSVLESMQCYEKSELYEMMSAFYDELLIKAYAVIDAYALIGVEKITESTGMEPDLIGKHAVFVLLTLGDQIKQSVDELFADNQYMKGMLLDTIADHYLFSMEDALKDQLHKICQECNAGIKRRLEVMNGLPIAFQETIIDVLHAEDYGITVNESFMLDPIKSMTYVLLLDRDTMTFNVEHQCEECSNKACKMREQPVHVTIDHPDGGRFVLRKQESIAQLLERIGLSLYMPCGGHGTCGKCTIRLISGTLPITDSDHDLLSEGELQQGIRLACKAYPVKDCEITIDRLIDKKEDYQAISKYHGTMEPTHQENGYGIGIDIGTTTIAMQLVDLSAGKILDTYTTLNSQHVYGADVISRIEAACKDSGQAQKQRDAVRADLSQGILALCNHMEHVEQIKKISIAANTTMMHLLLGLSCENLGKYPFSPVMTEQRYENADILFQTKPSVSLNATQVNLLPGISAFVGADIVAGLMACGFMKRETISLLIDLGTNGEIVLGNKDRLLCTSTAAGPAFEGGNLSCGVGSIAGAVCGVSIKDQKIELTTIQDASPCGICGTGMVDLAAQLLEHHYMDETGLLTDEYFDTGFYLVRSPKSIYVTQKDIREFQMAKAAVRAGIELLCLRYGCSFDQIDHIYLAGGFGFKINIKNAMKIGLLPNGVKGNIQAVGNGALRGAVLDLLLKEASQIEQELVLHSKHLSLSEDEKFQTLYMEAMYMKEGNLV